MVPGSTLDQTMTDQDQAPQPYTECPECGSPELRAITSEERTYNLDGSFTDEDWDRWLECLDCGANTRDKIVPVWNLERHDVTLERALG